MSPIRTYLDTNLLIGAALGNQLASIKALEILADDNRIFVSSIFSKMETLPTPMRKGDVNEETFYRKFYSRVSDWAVNIEQIVETAINLSGSTSIKIMDACHVTAAISLQADEFITVEKQNSPLLKAPGIKITSILPLSTNP